MSGTDASVCAHVDLHVCCMTSSEAVQGFMSDLIKSQNEYKL